MTLENYFDYAATSPVDPLVVQEMQPFWSESFGNPSSVHQWGLNTRSAMEKARLRISEAIGAEDPSQIFFTSGATESNNWVLSQHSEGYISPWEHSSVRERALAQSYQVLSAQDIEELTFQSNQNEFQGFLSITSACNETGQEIEVTKLLSPHRVVHTDATQKLFKYPFVLDTIDYVSFSSHKFYGPKGVGGLYARDANMQPLLLGGHQEHGLRSGTLNVASIVGMGVAAKIALENQNEFRSHTLELRQLLIDSLQKIPDFLINGGPNPSPHILSLSFLGVEGEALVLALDSAGYAISSGAACSSESNEISPALIASGIPMEYIRGTIRISFGRYNTLKSTESIAKVIVKTVEELRSLTST